MKIYYSLVFLVVVLFGCSLGDRPLTQKSIDGTYSLELPSSYTENKTLNAESTFSFSNLTDEVYIIVVVEKKNQFKNTIKYFGLEDVCSNNLEDYSEVCLDNMKSNEVINAYKISEKEALKIQGYNAFTAEVLARVDELDVFYQATYVEGRTHYYQILSWTLLDRAEKNRPIFKKIHESFKELYPNI